MKKKFTISMLFACLLTLSSCGNSKSFPPENDEKRDYLENQREEYNPPGDKGDIEEKAEEKIEINDEIKE